VKIEAKVKRADAHPMPQINSMCFVPVRSRIEMNLVAPQSPRFIEDPFQQRTCVTAASMPRRGDEVVDVKVMAPGQVVRRAKAGHRHGILVFALECRNQAVTFGAL
jgi:hypothetical protein